MAENFIIDPTSASPSQIKADLEAFLASAPDAAKWQGFFDSQVGQTVIKTIAGLGAFLKYGEIVGRREAYIQYGLNRSSLIARAQGHGYSVYQGRNERLALTVVPNVTTVLERYSIVGSVKDKDLVLLEDTPVTSGVTVVLNVVIGERNSQSITVTDDDIAIFRFTDPDVSEDYRVKLNGVELDISERIIDMEDGYYACLANVYGAIDVMSLNNNDTNTYETGDTITLEYITLKELEYLASDPKFDYGTLTSFETTDSYLPPETKDEIRVNAPLYHETQARIRGRLDYMKVFKFLDTSIISTNQRDVSAAVIELVYVRNDLTVFTDAEKQTFIEELAAKREFGVAHPTMSDPKRVPLKLVFTVKLLTNDGDPVNTIEEVVSAYEKKLEDDKTIDFDTLENQVEAYDFIKTARIVISGDTWETLGQHEKGSYLLPVTDNGFVYEVTERFYKTHETDEPVWPTTVGGQVTDGEIVWECETMNLCTDLYTWTADTKKVIDDVVVPTTPNSFMYRVVNHINRSFGVNEQQLITFSTEPDAGTWRIHFGDEKTEDLNFDDPALVVQAALRSLDSLSDVEVTGDYTTGFTLNFVGEDGNKAQPEVSFVDAGANEVQQILFTDGAGNGLVPNSGTWSLDFDGQITSVLNYDADAATVKSALESLSNIDDVNVTGDITNGFLIEFRGSNELSDVPLLVQSSLSDSGQDEKQEIEATISPTSGTFRLHLGDEFTADMPYDSTASFIQSELRNFDALSDVVVTGTLATKIEVHFTGNDGKKAWANIDVSNAGRNAIHKVLFSTVPDFGTWRIHKGSEKTSDLQYNATLAEIKSAVESAFTGIDEVTVTGDYATGILIEYIGATCELSPQELVLVSDAGKDEVQRLDFEYSGGGQAKPNDGYCTVLFDGEETAAFNYSYLNSDTTLKAKLESLDNIDEVDVSGSFEDGFEITFKGENEKKDVPQITVGTNNLAVKEDSAIVIENYTDLATLDGKYFTIDSPTVGYYVWFNLDGNNSDPSVGGRTAIEVPVTTGFSDTAIAAATRLAINNVAAFESEAIGNVVSVTNVVQGSATDSADVDTGFSISTLRQGASSVTIVPSTTTQGEYPASNLVRLGEEVVMSTEETRSGLIVANSLSPSTVLSVLETQVGRDPVSSLERNSVAVSVDITEQTKGEVPAASITKSSNPVEITPSTVVDARDVEPTWPTEIGETVYDGSIVWIAVRYNGTPDEWIPYTNYEQGDYVKPSTDVFDSSSQQLMYQCLSFVGNSEASEPTWPTTVGDTVEDGDMVLTARDPKDSPSELEWNEFYSIEQEVISS